MSSPVECEVLEKRGPVKVKLDLNGCKQSLAYSHA